MNNISVTDGQSGLERLGKQGKTLSAHRMGLYVGTGICLFASLLFFYGFHYPLHHDLAGSVLSGRLAVVLGDSYREYSIYFPPAERIWYSLTAHLSNLTGLRLDLAIVVMTGIVLLFGAALAYRIRRETVGASPLFFIGSVAVLVIMPILFKNVFGLREHIVAIGLWPYIVLRLSDPECSLISRRVRVVLGLFMGATLLLKYLYSVVVLLVEVADATMRRKPSLLFRAENLVAGAVVALYLFSWLAVDHSQRKAISAMFSAIDANLMDPVTNGLTAISHLGFAAGFLALMIGFRVPSRIVAIGLATLIGAVIVAWSQERWYTHHLFPIFLAYVLWWWMANSSIRWWGHVVVAFCLSYPLAQQFESTFRYREQVAEVDRAIRDAGASVHGKRVGVLNMHPSPYNQYLASHGGIRWNSLMNNAYVAAELEPFDRKENEGELPPPVKLDDPGRRLLHDQMIRLWEDMPPDVLILDSGHRWPLRYIDVKWVHEFSSDPRFGSILKRYRPAFTHKGRETAFTYYVRTK